MANIFLTALTIVGYLKRNEDRPEFPVPSHVFVKVPLSDGWWSNPCQSNLKSADNISL